MADLDHAKVVLSGILPDRRDLLVETMRWLEPEHFANEVQRTMWRVLVKYYELSGGVLTRRYIDELAKVDAARSTLLGELYEQCANSRVIDSEVRTSIQVMREIRATHLTGEAITRGMEILVRGGEVDGKEVEPGATTAWEFLRSEDARIAHLGTSDAAPEGDVFVEPEEGLADYVERKRQAAVPGGSGIRTGITRIDDGLGGIQPGEFMLAVGYTGSGKSMFCTQTAWHVSTQQRRNVVYATSETTRAMTRRRVYARHSRLDRFGTQGGLNSKDLKLGRLSEEGERTLRAVTSDLAEGARTGQYGHLYIAQLPVDATWGYVQAMVARVGSRWPVDLLIVDYLALLKPERKRESSTFEFTDMLKNVKTWAASTADGKGISIISPWAVQQPRFWEAKDKREYSLASLSDTSEAEKSPDILMWMLVLPDEPGKVGAGFLKTRDSDLPANFQMESDFASTYLGDVREATEVSEYLDQMHGGSRVG
jgi:replicative DNA helicase